MSYFSISKKIFVVVAITIASIYGCTNNKGDTPGPLSTCDTANMSYVTDINPIIQRNCAVSGCHTNATRAGGYSYETYNGLKQVVDNGRLTGAINHRTGFVAMPQNAAKLSDCNIAKITQWVANGAPNN